MDSKEISIPSVLPFGQHEVAVMSEVSTQSSLFKLVYLSPPKHAVKLPYWSSEWYRQYRREVARHMYISYLVSLMSCLSLHAVPHFRSEAAPDVLFFMNQSHNP